MDASQLTPEEFGQFQAFILKLCGISVPGNKITLLSNRIRRRLKATKIPDFDSYYKFLTSPAGRQELEGFLSAVTTNETSFFRTEKHFDWLRTEFIDQLQGAIRSGERARTVRLWSAACSTGEEPYSIAMCLAEIDTSFPIARLRSSVPISANRRLPRPARGFSTTPASMTFRRACGRDIFNARSEPMLGGETRSEGW